MSVETKQCSICIEAPPYRQCLARGADECAYLVSLQAALREALELGTRSHYYCEDCWYTCPKHPEGCCNEFEEDACNCGADKGRVIVQFPNPTKWIGFTGDQAVDIAKALIHHAKKAGLTKPFTIEI